MIVNVGYEKKINIKHPIMARTDWLIRNHANLALGLGLGKLPGNHLVNPLVARLSSCLGRSQKRLALVGWGKGHCVSHWRSQKNSYLLPDTEYFSILTVSTAGPVCNSWSSAMHMNIIDFLPWSVSPLSVQSHVCFMFLTLSSPD